MFYTSLMESLEILMHVLEFESESTGIEHLIKQLFSFLNTLIGLDLH